MAKGTFGERLKRERELREVSLGEVGKGTRIAERFLQALENEQWDRLPAGVFGRGFVRSIARYLGLSEEDLLAEYDLARGESANPAAQRPEERIPSPPKWIPAVAALAIAVLVAALVLGGLYAWKAYQAHRAPKRSSAAAQPRLLLDMNGHRLRPRDSPVSSGTIVLTRTDLRQAKGGDTER
jgi:cytoskeletal protein RodZ